MFRFLLLLLSIFLYTNATQVVAQNITDDNQIYGLNPVIFNGQVYNYFPGAGVKGHQYFEQKDFIEGCISIRGTKYEGVFLNYDILNQEVILKYIDRQGSYRLLAVSKAWLEKFRISNEEFSLIENAQEQKFIVQTLNEGKFQLHLHWTKKLVADISFVSEHYVFDKKKQTLFLSFNNTLEEYKSTKDILELLNDEAQAKLKQYIKKNKIKSRSSSLDQLIGLINYCNQLDL